MTIFDHLRRTEARLEAAEREQALKDQRPKLAALEKLARGIVRAQDKQETHALKKRIGKLQRAAAGYLDVEQDDAARALAEAASLVQRNEARNQAELEAHKTADRQARWNVQRAHILHERARLRRAAEDSGGTIGFLDVGPLPTACPSWYEAPADGVIVTHHRPSVPLPIRHPDGTVTLEAGYDMIGRGQPGPRLKTAEEIFAEEAQR